MKRLLLSAAAFFALDTPLLADEPWITYGQTLPPASGKVYNPAANFRGAQGEVQLPWVVPPRKKLIITRWGIEGYPVPGGVVLTIFTGPAVPPPSNSEFLHSVLADAQYNETNGNEYVFSEGTIINALIISAETTKQVSGWVISGRLVTIESPMPPEPEPTPNPVPVPVPEPEPPCNC